MSDSPSTPELTDPKRDSIHFGLNHGDALIRELRIMGAVERIIAARALLSSAPRGEGEREACDCANCKSHDSGFRWCCRRDHQLGGPDSFDVPESDLRAEAARPSPAPRAEAVEREALAKVVLAFIQRLDETRARVTGNAYTDMYVLAVAEYGLDPAHPDLWPDEPDYCREIHALASAHRVRHPLAAPHENGSEA